MPDTESTSPTFWVDSQVDLVTAVVDQLIPPAEGLPGAGEVEVAGYLDRVVGKAVACGVSLAREWRRFKLWPRRNLKPTLWPWIRFGR